LQAVFRVEEELESSITSSFWHCGFAIYKSKHGRQE
jgi:hypothetical protein